MASLQLQGLLGDAGINLSAESYLRPQITLDSEDMRQEVRSDLDRDLDMEDIMLGSNSSPLFRGCKSVSDPANCFPTQSAAWPFPLHEVHVFEELENNRDIDSKPKISIIIDECEDDPTKSVTATCESDPSWFLNNKKDTDYMSNLHNTYKGTTPTEGEDMLKHLDEDTSGLTPPGWSAPLLIDISAVAPLGGAAIGQKEAEQGMKEAKNQRSSYRNNETFITRVNEEAEAIARGELTAARRAKHDREQGKLPVTGNIILDPTMDEEVVNFDFSTLRQDEGKTQVRRCWSSTEPVDVTDFKKLIPFPAVQYPFTLDTFQMEAIYHIEANENVFVAAHTSAGKTVVAEYAIGLSMKRGSKVIYTSPIKTLSNQKFRDFTEKFEDVGIMTGDVQLKTGSSCLIMTTEILRSMLYLDASFTNDVEYIVFDEVHYVSDPERGYVWEEIIILLPKNIKLIMLSATVPNVEVFADWVGRTRGSTVHVVGTLKRPVPLKHSFYYDQKEYPLVDSGKSHFDTMSYKAVQSLHETKHSKLKNLSYKAKMANEAREWRELIRYLQKNKRLPAIIFAFSKNKLDSIADKLGAMSFTTKSEKAAIEAFLRQAMSRLKGSDKSIPQVTKIFTLLKRGMAVHHAGLLPIIKEVVEVLFCKGLIRVLFATATFAMGVNAPASTVVFAQTQKIDDGGKKDLTPGEYIQMSGRAGRRGLDSVGHVMIANIGEFPSEVSLKTMMTGSPVELVSSFRITYSMILNNLLSPFAGISYVMRHSFAEARTNKYHPVYCALRDKYLQIQSNDETATSENASRMYKEAKTWVEGCKFLTGRTFESGSAASSKFLTPGRVVILEIAPMVVTLGYIVKTSPHDLTCMILMCDTTNRLYNPSRCFIPDTAASAPLDEVTIRRDKLVAVLLKSVVETPDFSMPKDKKGAVDKRKGVSLVMPKPGAMAFNPHDKKCLQETGEKMRSEFSSIQLKDVIPSAATDLKSVDCQNDVRTAADNAVQIREGSYSLEDMNKAHQTADTKRLVSLYSRLADDDGLYLMPDYRGRLEVMAKLQLVEGTDDKHYDFHVTTKGRCASCVSSMDSIVAVEMIYEGILDSLEPPLIAAVLSSFICSNKVFDNQSYSLPPELQAVEDSLVELITKLWKIQTSIFEVPDLDAYISRVINFSISEAVWEWAHGTPFLSILDSTTAREGTLIRDITRLYGLCKEFKNAALSLGDTALHAKISEAAELIRRDVVFCTSLYLEPA